MWRRTVCIVLPAHASLPSGAYLGSARKNLYHNSLVVDDHDAVRKAICQLLRSQSDFEVVCEVADGFEAVRRTEELQPDVVVLDISMPNLNGIEAARHIRRVATGAEILLTQHNSSQIVREALSTGARGYVLKTEAANE